MGISYSYLYADDVVVEIRNPWGVGWSNPPAGFV